MINKYLKHLISLLSITFFLTLGTYSSYAKNLTSVTSVDEIKCKKGWMDYEIDNKILKSHEKSHEVHFMTVGNDEYYIKGCSLRTAASINSEDQCYYTFSLWKYNQSKFVFINNFPIDGVFCVNYTNNNTTLVSKDNYFTLEIDPARGITGFIDYTFKLEKNKFYLHQFSFAEYESVDSNYCFDNGSIPFDKLKLKRSVMYKDNPASNHRIELSNMKYKILKRYYR